MTALNSSTLPPKPKEKWLSLQVIRGLAALMVVVSHLSHWKCFTPGQVFEGAQGVAVCLGVFSVYVFFCLSGIVMMIAHGKEMGAPSKDRPALFRRFWIKRVLRLYPVYLLFLAVSFLLARAGFVGIDASIGRLSSWKGFFAAISLLQPAHVGIATAWSLCFEIMFYALFSLFLVDMRAGAAVTTLAVAGIVLSWAGVFGEIWVASPINFFFAIGILLFAFRQRLPWSTRWSPVAVALSLALFGGAALWFGTLSVIDSPSAFAMVAVALVLLFLPALKGKVSTPGIGSRIGLWLGNISYSLYLSHEMVQMVVYRYAGRPIGPLRIALYVGLPLIVAWLSYRWIERPTMQWAERWTRRRTPEVPLPPSVSEAKTISPSP
jgi:exopolysaccharide production protein ExoZ